ncbi:LuxR family transcriptional regulator [Pandoraea iniqua]|uniref:helix-turn-helix transcriptional regulator n=1 Tax=Pandoraea iniqua TaxID=2508288 RepID=UPI001240AF03|nr:helix-turn-helix transcriptional regulator [Pandoraea iniqua]VVD74554.1 LuxR family transcriptional regulator [Pandoraea iniqua]
MTVDIGQRLRSFFDAMPGCWGCKDVDSAFLYANESYARLMGVAHPMDLPGRTDFELPCRTVECASEFRAQDAEVMRTRRTLEVFDWHPYADDEWQAHVVTKTPLMDDAGQVVGTIFHGANLSSVPAYVALGPLLNQMWCGDRVTMREGQTSLAIDRHIDIALSSRACEVIFFYVRGWSAKMIGKVLGVSPRTVEMHLEVLKEKFRASTRAELMDSAIALGYLTRIPATLFNRQLSVVLTPRQ